MPYSGYIIDIKVEKTNNCPEGYLPLVNYEWPGSVDGCYCSSNNNGYVFDFVLEVIMFLVRENAIVNLYL